MSPASRRPLDPRHALTRWLDHYGDPVLVVGALVTIPLLIAESADLGDADERLVGVANWTIYALFALNVVVRLAVARDRRATLTSLRWDLVVVVGQPLVALSGVESNGLGVALVRLAAVLLRTVSRGHVVRRTWARAVAQPLKLLLGAVPFLWLLFSAIVLHAERRWGPEGTVQTIGEALWWGAATMATVGYGDISPKSPTARFAAIGTMVVGIGAFSILTAKLAEFLLAVRDDDRDDDLGGRDHVVLLGWSPKVPTIVRELVEAGAHRPANQLVVLCDRPAGEVERELHRRVPELAWSTTTLTCRHGSPRDLVALAGLDLEHARAVVVTEPAADPTATVMALLAVLGSPDAPAIPIVAEIGDAGVAASVRAAFGERVLVVEPVSLIARITALSCRQPGLGHAYEELLDFAGCELYVVDADDLVGTAFGDLPDWFPTCCPVGVVDERNRVELAPWASRALHAGDRLVVLAEDVTAVRTEPPAAARTPDRPVDPAAPPPVPERLVIVGWNRLGPPLIGELGHHLDDDAEVTVLADRAAHDLEGLRLARGTLRVEDDDPDAHADLLDDCVARGCDHVVILGDHQLGASAADARSMLRALQVRRADAGRQVRSMVIELLDEANASLARQATVGEFIISDRLTSLLMAQVAENPARAPIFDQLLRPDGPELYAHPADWYAPVGEPVTFAAVARAAAAREEVAVGVRIAASATTADDRFGITLNPAKAATLTFSADDAVIVLGDGPRARRLAGA